jgi:hypothetical protein
VSKHPRRESPAKAARAQAEARTQAKAAKAQAEAAQAQAELVEAKAKVAKEQDAAIARALQEDEARRHADLAEVAEKEAEAVPDWPPRRLIIAEPVARDRNGRLRQLTRSACRPAGRGPG